MIKKEYPITVLYRRRLFILLVGLLFLPIGMRAQTADDKKGKTTDGDSVAIRTVLYFSRNNADWIERSEYLKVGRFLRWALQDTLSQIHLSGWADTTGTAAFNEQFSLRRARTVRNYLVRKGVSADRIRIEGKGVDIHEPDDALCRRVEMLGIRLPDFTTTAEDTFPPEQIAMPVTETQGVAKDTLQSKDTLSVAKVPLQVSNDTMPITAEVSQQAVEHADTTVRQTEQEEQTSVIIRQPTTISPEPSATSVHTGWYVGIQAGLPFGVSAYSSFGADKTRAGWSAGIYGGYRFNPVLSLEVQAVWGQLNLSSRDCCPGYWLGSDGRIYEGAVAGMEGWDWHSLKSRVFMQRYGMQLNVDILGFFAATKGGRWSLEVSPQLNATGTRATFRTITGNAEAMKGATGWHFGAGGNVQAGYRLTKNLQIGVYTGLIYYTGDPIDGTFKYLHKANYVWESGVRLGWHFGNKGKEAQR